MELAVHTIKEGEQLPPWFYGMAYIDHYRFMSVYHIIPLNFVVRFFRWLSYHWDFWRSRNTGLDNYINNIMVERMKKQDSDYINGFDFGKVVGYVDGYEAARTKKNPKWTRASLEAIGNARRKM